MEQEPGNQSQSSDSASALARFGLASLHRPILLGMLGCGILTFALPIYGKQLGASALQIGGLFSGGSIVTVLGRPIVGWAMDRAGRKVFFVSALACYAVTMALLAAADSIAGLYVARVVQGIASSFMWISAYTIATDVVPTHDRGQSVGRVDEASAQGQLYGATAGFFVLWYLPFATGWHVLFAAYAGLALVGAVLAWKWVPETRTAQMTRVPSEPVLSGQLLRLMLIVFVTNLSSLMITPLLLIFLQDRYGADFKLLAMAYVPAALAYSFLPSRMGRLSDQFGRVPLMAVGLIGSALASLLMPGLPGVIWLAALWIVEAIGLVAAAPAQEALVADVAGNEVRGTAYGAYMFAVSLGGTIGPLLGGWLYDNAGHATPFYVNGVVLLIATAGVWLLLRRHDYARAERAEVVEG